MNKGKKCQRVGLCRRYWAAYPVLSSSTPLICFPSGLVSLADGCGCYRICLPFGCQSFGGRCFLRKVELLTKLRSKQFLMNCSGLLPESAALATCVLLGASKQWARHSILPHSSWHHSWELTARLSVLCWVLGSSVRWKQVWGFLDTLLPPFPVTSHSPLHPPPHLHETLRQLQGVNTLFSIQNEYGNSHKKVAKWTKT
jgi:hypothetical protein